MKAKYRVTNGVFVSHEFVGYELGGRIIDDETVGRSYPIDNCIKLTNEDDCVHPYAFIYRKGDYEKCTKCGMVLCNG